MAVQWITPDELPTLWDGAEGVPVDVIDGMLDASRDACEAWLPAEGDPERPRDRTIRLAQLTLVRGLWNDALAGEDGLLGADGFDYNPPWLAREARRMMRPQRGGNSLATGHDDIPTLPPAIAPVTLTWPNGSTAAFSRAGDIVTVVATPALGALPTEILSLPTEFSPAGNVFQYQASAAGTEEPGNIWAMTISEISGIGPELGVGLTPLGEFPPYEPATFTWLADPVVS